MRILITGGSGFVGKPLCARLHERGHELLVVSRNPERARAALPARTDIRPNVADFLDSQPEAIINLAGESIAEGRWTEAKKQRLLDSRLNTTQAVVDLCGQLDTPPKTLISASAMGYYGDQGDREVTEETPPNPEFVHELCARWEEAARQAESHGVRVALMRIGLVLDRDGGTLAKLLTPFRLGLGGPLGSGKQYMPWIHRTDLVRIILFLLDQEALAGPFNAGAPEPVTNAEFTRTLARHLHRPAFLPAPAPALRLAFGEMSRILLTGARMRPQRLQEAGFTFEYPTLDEALSEILRSR
ncbi:MAG: TIGR01777 family oxidoreductase [Halorhodospira halophila]|uniref:TIGR01777 family oxidoreductase n=1 Tax=Halorhodospira TaxID=85108 RepID=UPI001914AD39|nr:MULTISPECIES: TIGR01777 family oxidoreductase [Halorhodospira]MBK5937504.1 TIGR01777 family protein [Halorhodospira halophila]MBK5942513.1 TIGR01777 family protein [Halorhodospira halophila]MCC3751005.1 TIGR01777 family oxidoreductase [Halorhodospira halophila]MCG5532063.1 TIGR01777 family oxidoreductase [Halorhodospira sp. 9621]MCG5540123.1 TIGR01777 family oxidoreductase [Halorhodospira sp. M39old]